MSAALHPQRMRMLGLIGCLHAFTHLYQVALLPLYLRIQTDLKLKSIEQATLLVTVMGLAYFLPSYPLGALADRLSRRKLLSAGLAINGLGFVMLSFAPNYRMALLSVAAAGFGGSFYHPSATALIAWLFPEGRGRALGLVGIGASIGFFLGPVYSGWRVVHSGNWRTPVLELGVLGLIVAGVFAWLAHEDLPATLIASSEQTPKPAQAHPLFPTPSLWMFFLLSALFFSLRDFAGSAMATSASLFLPNVHSFDPLQTGLALSGIYLASALSNPVFGHLSDGGRTRWGASALFLAALLVSVFPRVGNPWMTCSLIGFGFFFMASYPITEAALMESVPDQVRGRVFGLFITIGGLVGNVSHWFVGDWVRRLASRAAFADSYNPFYGLLSLLILLALAGFPCLAALRKREHILSTEKIAAVVST
jgi:MFS family permease